MKNYLLFFVLLVSCNAAPVKESHTENNTTQQPVEVTDSTTIKIKSIVEAIEKKELSSVSFLKQIMLDSVQFKMISAQEYFAFQKQQLEKSARFSANKEKTQKALNYLAGAILRADSNKNIFQVDFHLNAMLSNNSVYNEHHIKFLHQDFTELHLVYPQ